MKHVFIGDIHGKVEEVEKALSLDGLKVFVGDLQDSFDRTVEDHAKCFELVLSACENGEAELLYGNHELSYMYQSMECSGWDRERFGVFNRYKYRLDKVARNFYLPNPDTLVTHAGLTNHLWEEHTLTKENLWETLTEWCADMRSPAYYIGRFRGGRDKVGGIFWCDFNREFEPVPELTQIFGHTAYGGKVGIRQKENSYCIDCLDKVPNTFLTLDL